jgi:ATP-binding cassette subfamily C (CFTR/MRP) protein 1
MSAKGAFSELVHEFGGDHADESEQEKALAAEALARDNKLRRAEAVGKSAAASGTGRLEGRLIVAEKRHVGKIKGRIYTEYIRAGRGLVTLPLLLGAAFLMQGSVAVRLLLDNSHADHLLAARVHRCLVLSSVWLTWWQGDHFAMSQGEYMGIYATLGVSQALFTCQSAHMPGPSAAVR